MAKSAPKAPEGAVTYEKDGVYRFAYTPADRVAAEWDGFVPVDESAVEKQEKVEAKAADRS